MNMFDTMDHGCEYEVRNPEKTNNICNVTPSVLLASSFLVSKIVRKAFVNTRLRRLVCVREEKAINEKAIHEAFVLSSEIDWLVFVLC